jgi:hypothetical protein
VNAFQSGIGGGFSTTEQDVVVVKLDPSGTQTIYSTYFGGSSLDDGTAIAVDAAGSVVITGHTESTDLSDAAAHPGDAFPCTEFLHEPADVFVTKFDPSGTSLVYSTYLGAAAPISASA